MNKLDQIEHQGQGLIDLVVDCLEKKDFDFLKSALKLSRSFLTEAEFERLYSPFTVFVKLYKKIGAPALDLIKVYSDDVYEDGVEKDSFNDGMYQLTRNKMKPFEIEPQRGPYPRALAPSMQPFVKITPYDKVSDKKSDDDKVLFENEWLDVKETKDGYVYVEGRDGVAVLPFRVEEDGSKSFLIRNEDNPFYPDFITVITGRKDKEDKGEDWAVKTAVRELEEEAGIKADSNRFVYLGQVSQGKGSPPPDHFFVVDVTGLEQTKPETDGTVYEERSDNFWVTVEELLNYAKTSIDSYLSSFCLKLMLTDESDIKTATSESMLLTPHNTDQAPDADWRYPVRQEDPPTGHRPFMRNDQPWTKLKDTTEDSHTFFFGPAFPMNLTKLKEKKKKSFTEVLKQVKTRMTTL